MRIKIQKKPLSDLLDMLKYEEVDTAMLLDTAYLRGVADGKELENTQQEVKIIKVR